MNTEVLEKIEIKKGTDNITASKGWECCKCGEEMYRGESSCNYCKHSKCDSCRSFQV